MSAPQDSDDPAAAEVPGGTADLLTISRESVDREVTRRRDAVDVADRQSRGALMNDLGVALRIRYLRFGDLADLREAAVSGRAAVRADAGDAATRSEWLYQLSVTLISLFERRHELSDLDEAVDSVRQATACLGADNPAYARYVTRASIAQRMRFDRTGDPGDLEAAMAAGKSAVAAAPAGHPDRTLALCGLAGALWSQFEHDGSLADLDEAIESLTEAIAAMPEHFPDRGGVFGMLCGLLLTRSAARGGDSGDVDKAVELGRDGLAATPPGAEARSRRLSGLAVALRQRAEFNWRNARGDAARRDLDEAVALGTEALTAVAADNAGRAALMSDLAISLRSRSMLPGPAADLAAATELLRQATKLVAADDPHLAMFQSNLGVVLQSEGDGHVANLEEAVELGRAAVAAMDEDHPDQPGALMNLGLALCARFRARGASQDIREAVQLLSAALTRTPPDHIGRSRRQEALAMAMKIYFGQSTSRS